MQKTQSRQTSVAEPERPGSRASMSGTVRKARAPDPPKPEQQPQPLQQQQQQQQQPDEIQARQFPAMSYPSLMTGGLPVKRLSRPITPSGSQISEGRASLSFPVNPVSDERSDQVNPPDPVGLSDLPPTGLLRPRQPSFSYPIVKSLAKANPSPTRSPAVVEEKRAPFKFPARPAQPDPEDRSGRSRRFDSPQPTMRSLSPTSPMIATTSDALSTSPSSSSRCPHCKIHSWLPHSAGCPNRKA